MISEGVDTEEDGEMKEEKKEEGSGGKEVDTSPLIVAEKREQGAVLLGVFQAYFSAMGYPWVISVALPPGLTIYGTVYGSV